MPSVLIPMADYGHDPTEVSIPYTVFRDAGFTVDFATEAGKTPQCDKRMLEGITGTLVGADAQARAAYTDMSTNSTSFKEPRAWTDPSFSMDQYDLVMLPGGHEKTMRQIIESKTLHNHLAQFFPKTLRNAEGPKKTLAAICHGVQILAFTPSLSSSTQSYPLALDSAHIEPQVASEYKSVIHDCRTTAFPGFMETAIYQATRLFLGDYFKTYGGGSPNVEDYVKCGLDNPEAQFDAGPGVLSGRLTQPFIVEDDRYRYVSGRFQPDAERLAQRAVEMVRAASVLS